MGKKDLEIGIYYQVKSLEQLKKEFSEYTGASGTLMLSTDIGFNVKEMSKYCGQIGVATGLYSIKFLTTGENRWSWSRDMMIKVQMDKSMMTYKQRKGK